ncbi:DUF58 domain-containing protein [Limnoglobus roseus]|uniref:DUF58 domain-containing protein n=1 Tax=Limnoglobus roseus TaxID=2598579 RepID=A0A5C1A475_9BACT|nr:DUF58 domain-containing protein [Limnoglobus roseus]QEL13901.1 hypothetical protein PX52LOC_00759 [Limnoglobus roseus]
MLTSRGWWTVAAAMVLALLGLTGLGDLAPAVPILGVSLVAWFLAEWMIFSYRFRHALPRIEIEREILQGGRPVASAWAKSPCTVRITVTNSGSSRWPLAFLRDRVPEGRKVRAGSNRLVAELKPDEPVEIEYELRSSSAGLFRFEGVEVRLADLGGMFYRRVFLRSPLDVLVLPPLTDEEGKQRADKRFNTLPPPGLHRLRRAGGGGELLDLREYIPGDPPKMIAWKASARRDKLITKVFESDVPVRVMLFLDSSESVRIGPAGDTPVGKLAETASGIAQAAAASRDLVGLTRFDETTSDVLAPARTQVHTIRLLGKLAESAAKLPNPGPREHLELQDVAYPLAQELYPELFDQEVNARPWGMYWLPLLDTRWGWLFVLPIFTWYPYLAFVGYLFVNGIAARPAFQTFNAVVRMTMALRPRFGDVWLNIFGALATFLLILLWPAPVFVLGWFVTGIRGLLNPRKVRTKKRKQMAAIFVALDRDSSGMIERYLRDDEAYAERMGRFLADHHVRIPPKLYDHAGQYRYRCETKATVLANAIIGSVARARDNELYVILADLVDLGDDIAPLLKAVRVARSRHHHVMVVVPWPDDVPPPGAAARKADGERPTAKAVRLDVPLSHRQPGKFIHLALTRGYQQRYEKLRTEMARLGAGVVRVTLDDPVRAVLDRIDRLRGMRSRR